MPHSAACLLRLTTRLAVGTTTPPTQLRQATEKKTRREYDTSQQAGSDAVALLDSWKGCTSVDMQAPWRQTAGAGGSEFGKIKWFNALKGGFKTAGEAPRFKLWQLALADHVVRKRATRILARNADPTVVD